MGDGTEDIKFTPEQIAKGEQVTEYYEELSKNPGTTPPDETKTHIFKNLIARKKPDYNE